MAIELEEAIAIADKVNNMTTGQVRVRLKQLEQIRHLDFERTIELQYLLMKIITLAK